MPEAGLSKDVQLAMGVCIPYSESAAIQIAFAKIYNAWNVVPANAWGQGALLRTRAQYPCLVLFSMANLSNNPQNNDLCLRLMKVPKNTNKQNRKPAEKLKRPIVLNQAQKKQGKKEHKHKGLLSAVGGALGSAYSPGAGVLGSTAGSLLGDLFGWGDYESAAPVNFPLVSNTTVGFTTPLAAQIPMMHTEDGSCRVRKREYIKDIAMAPGYINEVFALNPADAATFPWLSTVAKNFEQFKFLGLTFGFRSLTANALGGVGSPGMGSVTLLTQYDIYDYTVTDKTHANNALYATSCKPAESMLHPVECDPEQTPTIPLYTGINEKPAALGDADRDLRLNFLGFTSVFTTGGPTIYTCGELWVTYDVMLYKPMVEANVALDAKSVLKTYQASKALKALKLDVKEPEQKEHAPDYDYIRTPTPRGRP
jgi:hypothetical protein